MGTRSDEARRIATNIAIRLSETGSSGTCSPGPSRMWPGPFFMSSLGAHHD